MYFFFFAKIFLKQRQIRTHQRIIYFCFPPQVVFFKLVEQREISLRSLTVLDLMIALMYQQIWSNIRFHPIYSRLILRTHSKIKVGNTLTLNNSKIHKWCCYNRKRNRHPDCLYLQLFSWKKSEKMPKPPMPVFSCMYKWTLGNKSWWDDTKIRYCQI